MIAGGIVGAEEEAGEVRVQVVDALADTCEAAEGGRDGEVRGVPAPFSVGQVAVAS